MTLYMWWLGGGLIVMYIAYEIWLECQAAKGSPEVITDDDDEIEGE